MLTLLLAAQATPLDAQPAEVDAHDARFEDAHDLLADPADLATPFIINGRDASVQDWPSTGGLILQADLKVQGFTLADQTILMCSSTLIAPDVVLLAAHCIDLEPLIAQFGGQVEIENPAYYWSRQPDLSGYQLFGPETELPADAVRAKSVHMPPEWDVYGMRLGLSENHDIGLMFLTQPQVNVPYAFLPQADTPEVDLEVGEDVVVVGWGQQTGDRQDLAPAGSIGIKQVGTSHVAEQAPYEFKVGEHVSDVRKCHGDSGGPSFKQVPTDSSETWRLVGVTSHSYDLSDCASTGGVDTRVSHYLPWIEATLRTGCETQQRSWCQVAGILPPPLADGTLPWEVEERRACGCATPALAGAAPAFLPASLLAGLLALIPGVLIRRQRP